MTLLIECLAFCIIFALIIVPSVKKNPLKWSYDYPPAIQKKLKDLGLVDKKVSIKSKSVIIRKAVASLILALTAAAMLHFINGADSFLEGFTSAYTIWLSITWFDAIVLDCIWFCHDKSIRIKGTEDMISEYHNYGYHILASIKGTLMGIPVCAVAAVLVMGFSKIF